MLYLNIFYLFQHLISESQINIILINLFLSIYFIKIIYTCESGCSGDGLIKAIKFFMEKKKIL